MRLGEFMCGICSAIGNVNEISNVVDGLKKLEYRGYDSSGIAFLENKQIKLIKSVGQISNLQKKINKKISSNIVIGHTRWATHGVVSEANAHPHISENKEFALVHNGIIENYEDLAKKYLKGVKFYSQTDTEVFVNLIAKQKGAVIKKLIDACKLVKGSYAVALINKNSNKIFVAKRKSPLMVACDGKSCMASSDLSVFVNKFEKCFILEDDEFAVMTGKNIVFYNKNGEKIKKEPIFINDFEFCEENLNEKFFMLKEIKEQSVVLKKTYFKYMSEDVCSNIDFEKLKKYKSFHFIACGTAYHSGLMGARYIQQFCHKDCKVSIASEFRYDNNILSKNCLYVFVSQSGETADTIACANLVKEKGLDTMCVTNVPYCSLNKLADVVLPTFAGKEVAVASTKAYVAQVFTLLIFAIKMSGNLSLHENLKKFVLSFDIQELNEEVLNFVYKFKNIFYIGREQDYVASLEGALKMKEIAYINCIGLAGGELKHGTLALIDENSLVIVVSTQKCLKEKIESNIQEVKARGGKILLISNFKHSVDVDMFLQLPSFEEFFMPIVSIVALQLMAFHYAVKLGYNPDKPRNLAKSVTVE